MPLTSSEPALEVLALVAAPKDANVVLTRTNGNGETVVDSAWRKATDAFTAAQQLLERITGAAAMV